MTKKLMPTKLCPACGEEMPAGKVGAGVSSSRFVVTNICSRCGLAEALSGFFWEKTVPSGVKKEALRQADKIRGGPQCSPS